jgi:hypothetical protein
VIQPINRPSIEFILQNFDNLLISSLIPDEAGRTLWSRFYGLQKTASWPKFLSALLHELNCDVESSDIKVSCLQEVLGMWFADWCVLAAD